MLSRPTWETNVVKPFELNVAYIKDTRSGYIELVGFIPVGTNSSDVDWPQYARNRYEDRFGIERDMYLRMTGTIDDYLNSVIKNYMKKLRVYI